VRRKLTDIGWTLVIVVLGIVALVSVLLGGQVAKDLFGTIGLGETAGSIWTFARWPVAVVAMMGVFAVIYGFAPDHEHRRFTWISPGSVLGVLIWIAGSGLFFLYLANFNNYGATYGAFATAIVLLLWLYLTSNAFLLGGELNGEIERAQIAGRGGPPPPTPPPSPGNPAPSPPGPSAARDAADATGSGPAEHGQARARQGPPRGRRAPRQGRHDHLGLPVRDDELKGARRAAEEALRRRRLGEGRRDRAAGRPARRRDGGSCGRGLRRGARRRLSGERLEGLAGVGGVGGPVVLDAEREVLERGADRVRAGAVADAVVLGVCAGGVEQDRRERRVADVAQQPAEVERRVGDRGVAPVDDAGERRRRRVGEQVLGAEVRVAQARRRGPGGRRRREQRLDRPRADAGTCAACVA
jgi:hypothetical protein